MGNAGACIVYMYRRNRGWGVGVEEQRKRGGVVRGYINTYEDW